MSTLLKNILLDGRNRNILISDGKFADVDAPADASAGKELDCSGLAILPAFYNTHTHAAMMAMRGYGDDRPLQKWLEEYVWPYEAGMTPGDIRKGSVDAIREMRSSGTVFFNDMYFEIEQTIDEVVKSGMCACIGVTVMENHPMVLFENKLEFIKNWRDPSGGRIQIAIAPHSIYTVGAERLKLSARVAAEYGIPLHIHVSETLTEVEDCKKAHGTTPVRYLDSLGVLNSNVIAAHCVHVDEEEWDILARRGVSVSHCPCSNMKLGSGRFPYELAIKSGVKITLGTDSVSSNNNLDMREEMKFAALLAKVNGNPELLPARQVLQWATANAAEAFGIKGGRIEKGYQADAILVDTANPRIIPSNDLISNWVYAADCSCIHSVLCQGKEIYSR